MVASDGDSAEVIARGQGHPIVADGHRMEVHVVDVSTDSNGDGSATVTYSEAFQNATVFPFVTALEDFGDNATLWFSAAGASTATVNIGGSSTTSGTVTLAVAVVGKDIAAT